MISRLLKNTEWSRATDYLSPVFFQIVPTIAMGKKIAKLASSYADHRAFADLCTERNAGLKSLGIAIDLRKNAETHTPLTEDQEFRVLTLYFWQLLYTDTPILDLRQVVFTSIPSGKLLWGPKPLFATFDAGFAQSIRDMYLGFYTDDFARFDRALVELNLFHARELFLEHFGGSQSAMAFDLDLFRKTFHDLFVSCKTNKTRIHPDFLAFGSGLFSLYEHLERHKRRFDVKAAFESARALGEGGEWLKNQPLQ